MNIPALALLIGGGSLIGSFTGFGTSTLLIPLLIIWYNLPTTLIIAGTAHIFTNSSRALVHITAISWKLVAWFTPIAVCTAFIGAQLTHTLDQVLVLRILGLLLVCYAIFNIWFRSIALRANATTLVLGGAAYGFIEGLTGTGGILRAALFIAYPLSSTAYIATNAIIALIVDIARLIVYTHHIPFLIFSWKAYIFFALTATVGASIGRFLVQHMKGTHVRMIVLYAILIVGIKLIIMPT